MLGDGVIGGRDLAVADSDGQDEIDVLERRLGGAGSLLAVAPADGQRVRVGDAALAADRGRHRRLKSSATAASDGPASTQPSPA